MTFIFKPTVDYSGFSLRRIGEPRFRHLLLLLGWVVYFLLYFLTENLIPIEKCHEVHSVVDDMIPFCEYFVLAYIFWYILVAASLLHYLFTDVESFKAMQLFIIITQAVAMIVYICWPSVQCLRPASFEHSNICTWILGIIYHFDTPTGVCPSLHVGYSVGIASVWLKDKKAPLWLKTAVVISVILICLSVMFVKQHSFVDVMAALPMCLLAELIVYRRKYFPKKNLQ